MIGGSSLVTCDIRRGEGGQSLVVGGSSKGEGGQSLVVGGPSLVTLEGGGRAIPCDRRVIPCKC